MQMATTGTLVTSDCEFERAIGQRFWAVNDLTSDTLELACQDLSRPGRPTDKAQTQPSLRQSCHLVQRRSTLIEKPSSMTETTQLSPGRRDCCQPLVCSAAPC